VGQSGTGCRVADARPACARGIRTHAGRCPGRRVVDRRDRPSFTRAPRGGTGTCRRIRLAGGSRTRPSGSSPPLDRGSPLPADRAPAPPPPRRQPFLPDVIELRPGARAQPWCSVLSRQGVAGAGDVARRRLAPGNEHADPRPAESCPEDGARGDGRRDALEGMREEDVPRADPEMPMRAPTLEHALPADERPLLDRHGVSSLAVPSEPNSVSAPPYTTSDRPGEPRSAEPRRARRSPRKSAVCGVESEQFASPRPWGKVGDRKPARTRGRKR
jgi:hypothetical protein